MGVTVFTPWQRDTKMDEPEAKEALTDILRGEGVLILYGSDTDVSFKCEGPEGEMLVHLMDR